MNRRIVKLVSVYSIMARLKRNVKTIQFEDDDVIEWCGELAEELRIHCGTQEKHQVLTVEDFYAELPCDVVDLNAVMASHGPDATCPAGHAEATESQLEGFTLTDVTDTVVINGKTYFRGVTTGERHVGYAHDTIYGSSAGGGYDKGDYLSYELHGQRIKVAIQSGYVLIRYNGVPLCRNGYVLIPSDYAEAFYLHCLIKIKWEDRLSGNIDGEVWKELNEKADTAVGNGRAHYHAPSRNGIERLMRVMTSFRRAMPNEQHSRFNSRYE